MACDTNLLRVHVIQVILYELHRSLEVGLIELIRNIPAQSTILSALLDHSVQEGGGVEQTGPLVCVGVV